MGTTLDLPITNLEQAVECLYDLNVGAIGVGTMRHERPHKPVMLLAVLDLIATGQVTPQHITWSRDLRARFTEYFDQVHQLNDDDTPENPFFYLRRDGFWLPLKVFDGLELPLECTPTVSDATAGRVFARFVNGFEQFVGEASKDLELLRRFTRKNAQILNYWRSALKPTKRRIECNYGHYSWIVGNRKINQRVTSVYA